MTGNKQLIQELRENEQYLRALFERSSTMVGLVDLQGRWIKVNQTTMDRFGYTEKDFQRLTVLEMTHPEDRHITPEYTAGIRSGVMPSWRGEKRYVSKNGAIFYMDLSVYPLCDQEGEVYGFIAMGVDITERRKTIEALVENERRLRTLMSNLPGMAFRCRHQPGWPLEFVSEGSFALTGYTPGELYSQELNEFACLIVPEDRQRVEETVRQAANDDGSYEVEYRIHTKKGALRWVWEKGTVVVPSDDKPVVIEGFITDITTRKQHEEQLTRLQAAVEHASETIVITDPDGIIQYVNPAFEQLTGYSRKEAIGNAPGILLKSGRHDRKFYESMWNTLMRGKIWKGSFINKNKQGEFFEEEATITPIINKAGKICNFVGVKRDATREAELKKQLQQAQRMEAIGTLAGGIAHDFNNILTSILGYAEVVRDHIPETGVAHTGIERVIQAGDQAAALVKQILAFSRQENEALHPTRLQQSITDVLQLLRASLPTTITLHQDIDPDCPPVLADITQIHQVIMNLCINARQAIGNNQGRIHITLAGKKLATPLIALDGTLLQPDDYAMIEVSDDGCGMSAELQTKIFDPFFTTKTVTEGTGLGLSVVHGIIKKHTGAITLSSTPGEGTVFRVYLPVCKVKVHADQEKKTLMLRGEETILLVDDEQLLVQMLHNGLVQLGYHVISFTSRSDALTYFSAHPDSIDLVVTDTTMPVMAGDVFSRELLRRKPDLPIILCTGFSEAIDEKTARKIGVREFIMKPVAPRDLAQSIRAIFQHGKHPHS